MLSFLFVISTKFQQSSLTFNTDNTFKPPINLKSKVHFVKILSITLRLVFDVGSSPISSSSTSVVVMIGRSRFLLNSAPQTEKSDRHTRSA